MRSRVLGCADPAFASPRAAFRVGANEHGIVVRGVSDQPVAQWPVEPRPSLWIAAPNEQEEWQPLADEISRLSAQLEELNQRLLPRADEAAPEVTAGLQANLRELHEVSDVADALHRELAIEVDQVRSLDSRITVLEDDVRRSQDAETLRRMGAPLTAVTPPDCPTLPPGTAVHSPHRLEALTNVVGRLASLNTAPTGFEPALPP